MIGSQTVTLAAATLLVAMGNAGSDQNCIRIGYSISGSTNSATEIAGTDHSQRFTDECATKLAQAMIYDDWSDPEDLCRTCFDGWTEDVARRNDCISTWLPGDSVYNWFKTCKESDDLPVVSNCPHEWMVSGDCGSSFVGLECEYGQQCCCGECNAAYISLCTESGWVGMEVNNDFGHCDESKCDGDGVCPPDFPVCDCVGDCIKAHCASGACSWIHNVNYISGPLNDGQPCERSYQDDTDDTKSICPAYMYRATSGEACDNVGLECAYGEECCCGECNPIMKSVCTEDGWEPMYIKACDGSTECDNWPSYWPPYTGNLTWPWGNATLMELNTASHPTPGLAWSTNETWPEWNTTTNTTNHPTGLAWANDTWLAWANETGPAWANGTWLAWANETGPAWANGTWLAWANVARMAWANETWPEWNTTTNSTSHPTGPAWANATDSTNATTTNDTQPTP